MIISSKLLGLLWFLTIVHVVGGLLFCIQHHRTVNVHNLFSEVFEEGKGGFFTLDLKVATIQLNVNIYNLCFNLRYIQDRRSVLCT